MKYNFYYLQYFVERYSYSLNLNLSKYANYSQSTLNKTSFLRHSDD